MITRLRLIDFMAHADTDLALGPGLNVLTGPNNTGKSAVVEALRCLTQNPPPRHVIRHGAAEARVSVTLSDGAVVTWVRRPKYALYELTRPGATEPEVFAKFGRTPPEAILDVLRLDLVPLEVGEPVDVHIGNQREPVFLLNEPGSAMAGFFAASSEAAHLVAMQGRLTERVRKTKSRVRELEARQAAITARLDKLAPLPDLEYRLSLADDREAALAALARTLPALERVLAEGRAMRSRLTALTRTGRVLRDLVAPPSLLPTAPLAARCARLARVATDTRRTTARLDRLTRLAAPPALADTAGLEKRGAALVQAERESRAMARRETVLARLAEPPVLSATAALAATVRRLRQTAGEVRDRRERTGRLTGLTPPPETVPTRPLAGLLDNLRATRAAVAAKEAALARADGAVVACEARVAARLDELGVCPLCGAALSTADFLGAGHAHDVAEHAS